MRRYHGNETVKQGIYFSTNDLSFHMREDNECLPGTAGDGYCKVPTIFMFLAAPVLGALFVVFLPVIGFVLFGTFAAQKLYRVAGDARYGLMRVLAPVWEPARAFLSRSRATKKNKVSKTEDAWSKEMRARLDKRDHDA